MKYYRIISDYGYGDKTWTERLIPEDEILAIFNEMHNRNCQTIDEAEDTDGDAIHYIEEDCEIDEEDWDWTDS